MACRYCEGFGGYYSEIAASMCESSVLSEKFAYFQRALQGLWQGAVRSEWP